MVRVEGEVVLIVVFLSHRLKQALLVSRLQGVQNTLVEVVAALVFSVPLLLHFLENLLFLLVNLKSLLGVEVVPRMLLPLLSRVATLGIHKFFEHPLVAQVYFLLLEN